MVNFDKYKNSGWGLSRHGFEKLYEILSHLEDNSNVVEFGSGVSTEFLVDFKLSKDINIISFENDPVYGFSGDKSNINFILTHLVDCDDNSFETLFEEKVYRSEFFRRKVTTPTTRQKNTFYEVGDSIPNNIDLVILDGPNGNGRSLSFLHLKNKMKNGAYIFIDDHTHYPYLEYCKKIFDVTIIYEHNGGRSNKWEMGGDFIILRII